MKELKSMSPLLLPHFLSLIPSTLLAISEKSSAGKESDVEVLHGGLKILHQGLGSSLVFMGLSLPSYQMKFSI